MLGNQLPVLTYSRQFMKESLNSDKIGDANEKIERMLYCYDTISAKQVSVDQHNVMVYIVSTNVQQSG